MPLEIELSTTHIIVLSRHNDCKAVVTMDMTAPPSQKKWGAEPPPPPSLVPAHITVTNRRRVVTMYCVCLDTCQFYAVLYIIL